MCYGSKHGGCGNICLLYIWKILRNKFVPKCFILLITKSCAQVNNFGVYLFQNGHLPRSKFPLQFYWKCIIISRRGTKENELN